MMTSSCLLRTVTGRSEVCPRASLHMCHMTHIHLIISSPLISVLNEGTGERRPSNDDSWLECLKGSGRCWKKIEGLSLPNREPSEDEFQQIGKTSS